MSSAFSTTDVWIRRLCARPLSLPFRSATLCHLTHARFLPHTVLQLSLSGLKHIRTFDPNFSKQAAMTPSGSASFSSGAHAHDICKDNRGYEQICKKHRLRTSALQSSFRLHTRITNPRTRCRATLGADLARQFGSRSMSTWKS